MQSAGLTEHAPRLAFLTAAAAAMTAEELDASALFAQALAHSGADRFPFHTARTRLAYGEHLHGVGADAPAREELEAALVVFRRLGAEPWIVRTAHALRAAGASAEKVELTPAEVEIANLAAAGLTNKQIGAQLFMSHRTVGAHLYRIFPKLGVTSRAALRDALATSPPGRPG
jgi:DNA-binding CsgD family transcriptional regulator